MLGISPGLVQGLIVVLNRLYQHTPQCFVKLQILKIFHTSDSAITPRGRGVPPLRQESAFQPNAYNYLSVRMVALVHCVSSGVF